MGQLLSRERLGRPQFLAALLLLAFLLQAVWLVSSRQNNSPRRIDEAYRVSEGVGQWSDPRQVIAGTPGEVADSPRLGIPAEIEKNSGYDPNHSPLWYLLAAAPFAVFSVPTSHFAWNCLQALPQLAFGLLLGASLWYV